MTTTYDWATDTTTITSVSNVDLLYAVGTSFTVITTLLDTPEVGSTGIKLTDGSAHLWFSYGPLEGASVINIPDPVNFIALQWNAGTYTPFYSVSGDIWQPFLMPPGEDGNPLPYPTFGTPTQAGLFLDTGPTTLEETVVFGSPRVLPGLLLVQGDADQWAIPEESEALKDIGVVPPTQPDPVTPSEEAIVHALVGAPFGDLEFDVGKSVGWLVRFVDDLFVTDLNSGDQRYWVVNWTKSFNHTYYKFSGLNYFVDPEIYRKGQFTDALAYADLHPDELVYDDNDWVIFLDAHEGLSTDTRSKPDDYLIEPYQSFIYREIARANNAAQDRIVFPNYIFLRHDHIQNVSHDYEFEDESFTVTQSVGVPYYLPNQGMTRMFKVSTLKNPAFDWSLIDTVVPSGASWSAVVPAIPAHLIPATGTVSTPDTAAENFGTGDFTIYIKFKVGSMSATARAMAAQRSTSTQMAWNVITSNRNIYLQVSSNGTAFTSATVFGAIPGGINTGDIIEMAFCCDANNTASGHTITTKLKQGAAWNVIGTNTVAGVLTLFNSTATVQVGGATGVPNAYDNWIYAAEARTGLDPTAGTVTWKFDATERTGTGPTYTDPRTRVWTLSAPTAIVATVPEVPAAFTPSPVKIQLVSYAYAHWNLQDIPPGETRVPPLSAENDQGWRQRCYMSMNLPVVGLPYGNIQNPVGTWVNPSADVAGLRGPWCFDVYADKVDGAVIPDPPPPVDIEVAGILVPMYDLVFRINVRDGVWYAADGVGNTQLIWNDDLQDWIAYGQPVPT